MLSPTLLQRRIGGSTRSLDRTAIVAAAERQLAAAAPQLELALQGYRFDLREGAIGPDVQAVFAAAHEIRGLAGSIGRSSLGRLADILASYISGRTDAALACASVVVQTLAAALDRAFELEEGDALLSEALQAAASLTAAFIPRPAGENREAARLEDADGGSHHSA